MLILVLFVLSVDKNVLEVCVKVILCVLNFCFLFLLFRVINVTFESSGLLKFVGICFLVVGVEGGGIM